MTGVDEVGRSLTGFFKGGYQALGISFYGNQYKV